MKIPKLPVSLTTLAIAAAAVAGLWLSRRRPAARLGVSSSVPTQPAPGAVARVSDYLSIPTQNTSARPSSAPSVGFVHTAEVKSSSPPLTLANVSSPALSSAAAAAVPPAPRLAPAASTPTIAQPAPMMAKAAAVAQKVSSNVIGSVARFTSRAGRWI